MEFCNSNYPRQPMAATGPMDDYFNNQFLNKWFGVPVGENCMADMYQMLELSRKYPGYSCEMGWDGQEYVAMISTPTGVKITVEGKWFDYDCYEKTVREIEDDINYQEWKQKQTTEQNIMFWSDL